MVAWKGTQRASAMRVGRERLLHGFHCSSERCKWKSVSCLSFSGCGASNLLISDTTSEGSGKGSKQVQFAMVAGGEGVPASEVSISTFPLSSSSLSGPAAAALCECEEAVPHQWHFAEFSGSQHGVDYHKDHHEECDVPLISHDLTQRPESKQAKRVRGPMFGAVIELR